MQSPVLDLASFDDRTREAALSRTISVHDFYPVARLAQQLADVFGDHHRAMLAACASETDGQVTFSFVNVMRKQVDQQFRDAADEFPGLRE